MPDALTINADLPALCAALRAAEAPEVILRDILARTGAGCYERGRQDAAAFCGALFTDKMGPEVYRRGFAAGRKAGARTFELPPELGQALTRLAEAAPPVINVHVPQSPPPAVTVEAPIINNDINVTVPSRPVKASPQGDGSVLMVPQ
jgi:hypothetical protein